MINAFHHERAVQMYKPPGFDHYSGPISVAKLTDEAREWCEMNTPGFEERTHKAANIIMEVSFQNEEDAALFKLMWL